MIDAFNHFVSNSLRSPPRALCVALQFCSLGRDAHGSRIAFDGEKAVQFVRQADRRLGVINPKNPAKRIEACSISNLDLHNMLALEVRTGVESRAMIKPLPRRVFEISFPGDPLPPHTSSSINPLDAAAAALGIETKDQNPMANLDLAALMKDPKKLGEFLATAVHTLGEIPKLKAQIDDAAAKQKTADDLRDAAQKLADDRAATITDLDDRLKLALTRASQGSVTTANPAGTGNDLVALAHAMHISPEQLKSELDSFVATCGLPLPNAVRWPEWCDPTDKSSPLPFCYRHHKPVFLAGESGTGKTFIAEALCMLEAGRRCAVTFHEKISYNKLFVRETVDGGKVRSVLGPILLSMLTGTPIVLDEIDHADVFVQSLMHEVLDKRRVFIPELALSIVAEKGCEFIATGNSLTDDSGQYHGDVGTALRTRFAAIHVEYPDKAIEADTVKTASNCVPAFALTIASVFAALRAAVQEQKLAGPISVRESCAVGTLFTQAKADGLADDAALGLALSIMVVQKRPPQEQLVAAEICATVARVAIGNFQGKVKSAGQQARASKGAKP